MAATEPNVKSAAASNLTLRIASAIVLMPLAFGAYHAGYGWGFLYGFVDFVVLRRGARESLKTLTRGGLS